MKRIITLLIMLFALTTATAQEKDTERDKDEVVLHHKVELGETVLMICKKYVVLPQDFYKYNKESIHGVQPNEILRIPLHKSKKKDAVKIFANQGVIASSETPAAKGAVKE